MWTKLPESTSSDGFERRYAKTSAVNDFGRHPIGAWLAGGLVAGIALDIYLAICLGIADHLKPLTLQQWFASNVLGIHAFSGGWGSALAGVAFHLLVSLAWTALFCVALAHIETLRRHVLAGAVGFGAIIFGIMQFVVIRLDAAPKSPPSSLDLCISAVGIIVFFAIPLSLIASRPYQRR